MMQDKQARKKYSEIKQYIQSQSSNSEAWLKHQENLQKQFSKLNDIINDYATKKQQNEKKFQEEVQTHLQSVFDEANNSVEKVSDLIGQRNYNWERVSNKMAVFMMLKQNIKQIYSINQKYQHNLPNHKQQN